jgi:HK97 family phage major capsid protein
MNYTEKIGKSQALFAEALAIQQSDELGAEDAEKRDNIIAEAHKLKLEAIKEMELLKEAEELNLLAMQIAQDSAAEVKSVPIQPTAWEERMARQKRIGAYLVEMWKMGNPKFFRHVMSPELEKLKYSPDEGESATGLGLDMDTKALAEGVGATGGFLVPTEFNATLQSFMWENNVIRQRATIIPMRRRSIRFPVVDQTGTAANQPHQFGGIVAQWTEEAQEKTETDPAFRQMELVAHKLVCYTRVSDELLDDSAIGLAAYLTGPAGFVGSINWLEDWAFLRGTGAGQPLGVINAGGTAVVARAAAGAVGVADIMNMVMTFGGSNGIWHITRRAMATLLQLNGPPANPSYIFIPNAREGVPATLMGYPIEWTEKLPALGTQGDFLLADWTYYIIGDRQATTIESSTHERFRFDQTAWRAVHRVDGQETLSAVPRLADGTGEISPFVILGDVAT